jgi:hypothetical protein
VCRRRLEAGSATNGTCTPLLDFCDRHVYEYRAIFHGEIETKTHNN